MSSETAIIAGNVRAALARAQITKTEVARAIDRSIATASRKANGHIPFSVPELFVIAGLVARATDRPDFDAAEFFAGTTTPIGMRSHSAHTEVA